MQRLLNQVPINNIISYQKFGTLLADPDRDRILARVSLSLSLCHSLSLSLSGSLSLSQALSLSLSLIEFMHLETNPGLAA